MGISDLVEKDAAGPAKSKLAAEMRGDEHRKIRSRQETQLTFLLSPKQLAAIETSAFLRNPAVKFCGTRQYVVSFYDGASRPLGAKGISLAVENSDGHFRQHLAVPLRDIGVAKLSRNWENPLPAETPLLSAISNEVQKELLQDCLGEGLGKILRRKIDASEYRLVTEKDTEIRIEIVGAKCTAGKRSVGHGTGTHTLARNRC
jgi:hypothetical protein